LLHTRLRAEGIASRLVIQRNTMEYEQPIQGEFTAHSMLEQPESWQQFIRTLARKGKAELPCCLCCSTPGRARAGSTVTLLRCARQAPDLWRSMMEPTQKAKGPASYFPSIEKKYGHPVEHWFAILRGAGPLKHMELVSLLKSEHGLGHGHANALVAYYVARQ
jgi:hypothetical protein